ncbi:MAG TPA: malonic semialdehyde reductase [Kineosporiaceae bacterium]|nr:malonic semialdehyde reductase [Kineosporiaceae bacterium]
MTITEQTATDAPTEGGPAEESPAEEGPGTLLALPAEAQALLFREAHTAGAFTDEPVGEDQIRAVYDLIKYAPTGMNTQPLRVALIRSPQARERLVRHMAPGNQDKTAKAPLVALLTADREFHEHLPVLAPHAPNAKDMFSDPQRRETWATFNGALQLGYFIVGVRAAGLAAGPMTGFDATGLESEFFPGGNQKVIAVVNIGHPAEGAFRPRAPRLEFEQVVSAL